MTPKYFRKNAARCAVLLATLTSGYACSSDSASGSKSGVGAKANSVCNEDSECASLSCVNHLCAFGSSLTNGMSCVKSTECQGGLCDDGICATASSQGGGGTNASGSGGASASPTGITAADPPFAGLGDGWRPLTTGCGPDTANQCGGTCEASSSGSDAAVIRPPALLCFGADATQGSVDPTSDTPAAIIEQVIETKDGVSYIHIRVTFDPAFADNTYGANASPEWYATKTDGKAGKGHTFISDLTGSDHVELLLTDAKSETVMDFKVDYVTSLTDSGKAGPVKPGPGTAAGGSASTTAVATTSTSGCSFGTLGVLGGDGGMITGDSSAILAAATSISRNVGGCGYCSNAACSADSKGTGDGDCTVNSPVTDASYTANALTPNFNYDVVYEVWVRLDAFGEAGFGQAYITKIHASPSKLASNTLYVVPQACPPTWNACPDGNCGWQGSGGAGGTPGTGGNGPCGTNYQVYITTEGASECTPIPFAGYPGFGACPEGYTLDIPSEGKYCVKS